MLRIVVDTNVYISATQNRPRLLWVNSDRAEDPRFVSNYVW